jgi:transcription elongation factor Elf1
VGLFYFQGGAPENPLLAQLVKKHTHNGKKSFSCVACGEQKKGNASLAQALKHALKCKKLEKSNKKLWSEVKVYTAKSSLGAQLKQSKKNPPKEPTSKKQNGGKLDVNHLWVVGKQKEKKSWEAFQSHVDHVIMRLICVHGLVSNIIDSAEWKDLLSLLNGNVRPTSSTTFADKIIPQEAAFVQDQMIDLLQTSSNLTLSFDSSSTQHPKSFYTAHVTTPQRISYFLDGHMGSSERHTTKWITDQLLKVI